MITCHTYDSGSSSGNREEGERLGPTSLDLLVHLEAFKDLNVFEAGFVQDLFHLGTLQAVTLHASMLSFACKYNRVSILVPLILCL